MGNIEHLAIASVPAQCWGEVYDEAQALQIGTEELAHMEIICAMVYQITKNLSIEEAKTAGFDAYYIDHTTALWPQAAAGLPFTALEMTKERLDAKNFYYFNPEFDKKFSRNN